MNNKINKIIFVAALLFLGFWIIFPFIRMVLSLEYASVDIYESYKKFLFFAVPISVILTLFGTLKAKDSLVLKTGKTVGTIAIALFIIFIIFMSVFADMCAWSDRQILYIQKDDPNTKIIVRDFGCGAWDSSPPVSSVFKVQHFTNYFIRSTRIDTATIDKTKWKKFKKMPAFSRYNYKFYQKF